MLNSQWHSTYHPMSDLWPVYCKDSHNESYETVLYFPLQKQDIHKIHIHVLHIKGQVQDCNNSSANALELLQSCAKPWIFTLQWKLHRVKTRSLCCSTLLVYIIYITIHKLLYTPPPRSSQTESLNHHPAMGRKCFLASVALTHWGRDKMAVIFLTTLSNAFSWIKIFKFRLRCHWRLLPRDQLTIFHH